MSLEDAQHMAEAMRTDAATHREWSCDELPEWYRDDNSAISELWLMHPGNYCVYGVRVGGGRDAPAHTGKVYIVVHWWARAWHIVGADAALESAKCIAKTYAQDWGLEARGAAWDMEPPTEFVSRTERGVTCYLRLRGAPVFIYEIEVAA